MLVYQRVYGIGSSNFFGSWNDHWSEDGIRAKVGLLGPLELTMHLVEMMRLTLNPQKKV